jgi:hypothetical protein
MMAWLDRLPRWAQRVLLYGGLLLAVMIVDWSYGCTGILGYLTQPFCH